MPRRNIKRPCMWFFWITAAPKLQRILFFRKFSAVFVVWSPVPTFRLSGFPPRRRPQDGLYLHWRNRSYSYLFFFHGKDKAKSPLPKLRYCESCANVCAGGIGFAAINSRHKGTCIGGTGRWRTGCASGIGYEKPQTFPYIT